MSDPSWSAPARRLAAALRHPMVLSIAIAAAVTLVLAIVVLTAWTASPKSPRDRSSQLAASIATSAAPSSGGPTPTPRVIVPRAARSATSPAASAPPDNAPSPTPRATSAPSPRPTVTAPHILMPRPVSSAKATSQSQATISARPTTALKPSATSGPKPLYDAEDASALENWSSGSWAVTNDLLSTDGGTGLPEPWITGPYQPRGDTYAIEAEIRVRDLAPNVCDQNFGVVAGPASGGTVWGGGILFPCAQNGTTSPRARVTDVSSWQDGYNQDRELGGKTFDPATAWHVYRLEVRGTDLRLLVDGKQLLKTTDTLAPPPDRPAQIGLWSQGVRLSVRRLAVLPLTAKSP
jgi:hypothetical protein